MWEGYPRAQKTKKYLIQLLFERATQEFGLSFQDIEITITETPRHDWEYSRFARR
jgi:hypothetical protein